MKKSNIPPWDFSAIVAFSIISLLIGLWLNPVLFKSPQKEVVPEDYVKDYHGIWKEFNKECKKENSVPGMVKYDGQLVILCWPDGMEVPEKI